MSSERATSKATGRDGSARLVHIPVYDVNLTGYPARMRQWTARQRRPDQR